MRFHKIISRREFNGSAYILRFERKDLIFTPGQHINVGIKDDDDRPYSIYSGINDDYIEILVKEVKNGNISNKLKLLKSGDEVSVGSPHGSFTIDTDAIFSASHFPILLRGLSRQPRRSKPEISGFQLSPQPVTR